VRRLDLSEPEKIELALAYGPEKRQGREEEKRQNNPAAEPSEEVQTTPAGRVEARKRAVAALPPEQREHGRRLLVRSDALSHAVAAVCSEGRPIEERKAETLEASRNCATRRARSLGDLTRRWASPASRRAMNRPGRVSYGVTRPQSLPGGKVNRVEDENRTKVTVMEAAEYLGLTPTTIQDMVERGVLKADKFAGAIHIPREEVERIERETAP
jgi:excisionase family DNA binding protein